MPTIPQKEIRNNVGEILRRAEAGEEFTITVSGRPVARLGPLVEEAGDEKSPWVDSAELGDLWKLPPDRALLDDLEKFGGGQLRNPWEIRPESGS